ncbi:unnamed protein product [Ceutorhynchus assimilis]|uniref:Myb/SANT-like DNA-binding domain-containing protein n=1 Tax=Ceutorhynchus assimilis TaxID=467358 RepID=A0A9N9QR90_9CUCU|nr:unnamed protein product [Ceutorhynchus assimilis]
MLAFKRLAVKMGENLEITYDFKDNFYTVVGNGEFHYRLQNDIGNKQNTGFGASCDPTPSTSTDFQSLWSSCSDIETNPKTEFKWTKQVTLLLLNLYKEKNEQFRNSKIKNKDIWSKILKEFQNKGYIVTIDLLDRKFRNMKKTYKDNKDKKKTTGESSITWEYFEIMDEIFFNDKTMNPTTTISSMEPVLKNSKVNLNSEVSTIVKVSDKENQEPKVEKKSEKELTKVIKAKRVKHLYDHRKKIQEIENQRLEEVQKLRQAIQRNNNIQEERNELLRQMLSRN